MILGVNLLYYGPMNDTTSSSKAPEGRAVGRNRRGSRFVQVTFLVTPEEKKQLQADAQRRGLGISGLLRAALSYFRERV